MMYSNILSLICTIWILLIPCAARVIVRDTGQYCFMAQMNTGNLYNELAPDIEGDDLLQLDVNVAIAVSGTYSVLTVHDKIVANRGKNSSCSKCGGGPVDASQQRLVATKCPRESIAQPRANEPQQTFAGSLRQPTIHEGVASWQLLTKTLAVFKRTGSAVGGFLFEYAVHDKIVDS
ncbi:uncharacterized protein HD556DRAFT_1307013 [Suillus plorans]|uniref:Uncharacterized protein n=1 Tax=Suillus plorans TaxID=116603 RepID=A0A9P7ATE1_9AGAM|nr:uncharacterized protein HD556DRAFT_1307013 [Suillus plorans]KAG1796259.1 hypothetical protein HD556DRAFT_1307013 [Suillus plorans]